MFSKFEESNKGKVTFGDTKNGRIIEVEKVCKDPPT